MPGTGGAKGAGNTRGRRAEVVRGAPGSLLWKVPHEEDKSFFFARCAEKKSRWVVSRCGLFALDNCVVLVAVCSDSRCLMTQLCSELGGRGCTVGSIQVHGWLPYAYFVGSSLIKVCGTFM